MSGFENYNHAVKEIEREIVIKGIVLNINWADKKQVNELAHDALNHLASDITKISTNTTFDRKLYARVTLYGLAGIMLQTLTESADHGFENNGGVAWQSFSRALLDESIIRNASTSPEL